MSDENGSAEDGSATYDAINRNLRRQSAERDALSRAAARRWANQPDDHAGHNHTNTSPTPAPPLIPDFETRAEAGRAALQTSHTARDIAEEYRRAQAPPQPTADFDPWGDRMDSYPVVPPPRQTPSAAAPPRAQAPPQPTASSHDWSGSGRRTVMEAAPAAQPRGKGDPPVPDPFTTRSDRLTKDIRQGLQSVIAAEAAHHAAARKKEAQAAAEAAAEQAELDSLNNAGKFAQRLSREKGHDLKITRLADESNYVVFPALINSFSDSFQSSWNPESVYGRMDPIMTFQNTQRTITVGFRIVGEDRLTMIKNQTKLSQLIKLLYPGYKGEDNNKYLAIAPLVRVQFANYIPNLVCAIGGLDYTPTFDETNAWIDYENSIAPTYFDLSLTLTVLHEHTLGFDEETDNKQFFESDTFGYGTDNSDDLRTLEKQLEAKMGNLTGPPPDAADEINLTRRQRRRLRRRERRGPQDLSRREARELGDRELLKRGIDDYRKNTGGSYAAGLEQITGGGGRR